MFFIVPEVSKRPSTNVHHSSPQKRRIRGPTTLPRRRIQRPTAARLTFRPPKRQTGPRRSQIPPPANSLTAAAADAVRHRRQRPSRGAPCATRGKVKFKSNSKYTNRTFPRVLTPSSCGRGPDLRGARPQNSSTLQTRTMAKNSPHSLSKTFGSKRDAHLPGIGRDGRADRGEQKMI